MRNSIETHHQADVLVLERAHFVGRQSGPLLDWHALASERGLAADARKKRLESALPKGKL